MNKGILNCISFISVIIGFLLLMYFISLFNNAIANSDQVPIPLNKLPSQVIYWLGILSVTLPSLFQDVNRKIRIFSVALLSVCVLLTYPLFSTTYGYPVGRDSIYSYQLCNIVYSDEHWNVSAATGIAKQYTHYPAMHIFIVTVSKVTGIPLIKIFPWTLPLLRLFLIPSLIFLIFREFLEEKLAMLAVFLYITNPSLINWIHHEGFAIIFLLISFYTAVKLMKTTTISLIIVNLIFGLILVLSHHFTAYVWLFWIIALFISSKISKRFLNKYNIDQKRYIYISSSYLLFFLVAFLSWGVYVANLYLFSQMIDIGRILPSILSPVSYSIRPSSAGISFRSYEKILIYGAIIIMGFYTLVGAKKCLEVILRKESMHKNRKIPMFFVINFIFCVALVVASVSLWTTGYYFILLRIFEFAYLGIIPIALLGITAIGDKGRVYRNMVIPLSLIILLGGGHIMNNSLRYYYVDRSIISSDNPLFLTPDIYEASIWFKNNYKGGSVLGDGLIYDALGGFGMSNVDMYNPELTMAVFGSDYINESIMESLRAGNITYIVTHRYLTRVPSVALSDRIYTEKQIGKFEEDIKFDSIFKNKAITIYEIIAVPKHPIKKSVRTDVMGGKILVLTKGSSRDNWMYGIFWDSQPLRNFQYDLLDVEKEDLPDEDKILRDYSLIVLDSTLDRSDLLNSTEKKALWNAIKRGTNAFFIYFSTVNFLGPEFNVTGSWNFSHEIRFNNESEIFPAALVGDTDYIYKSKNENISSEDSQFYFWRYEKLPKFFKPIINARIMGTDEWGPWLIYGEYGKGKIIAHAGRGDGITGSKDQYHIGIGRLNTRILYYLCEGCVQKTFGESLDVGIRIDDTGGPWLINGSIDKYHIKFLEDITNIFPRSTHQIYIRADSVFQTNSILKEMLLKYIEDRRIQTCLHDSGGYSDGYGSQFSYDSVYNRVKTAYESYTEFFGYRPYCWTTPQHSVNNNVTSAIERVGILVDMENRSEAFAFDNSHELTWGRHYGPNGTLVDGSGFTKGFITGFDEENLRMDKLDIYNSYINIGYPYYFYDHHYDFHQNLNNWNKTMTLLNDLDTGGLLEIHPQFLPAYAYKYLNVQNLSLDEQKNYRNGTIKIKLSNEVPVRGAGIRVIGRRIASAYLDGEEIYFIRNNIDGIVVLSEKLNRGEHELILNVGEGIDEPRITWSDGAIKDVSFDGQEFRFTSVSMPMMWNDIGLKSGEKEVIFSYISSTESVEMVFDTDLNPKKVLPKNSIWIIKQENS